MGSVRTTAQDPVSMIRDEVLEIVGDPDIDAAAKTAKLRVMRDTLKSTLGEVETYLGDQRLVQEAEASGHARRLLFARQNASIRDRLIASGRASNDDMDELGYLSHEELDRLAEEGLLEGTLKDLPGDPRRREPEGEVADQRIQSEPAGLGGPADDTETRFSDGNGTWDESRKPVHDQILSGMFSEQVWDEQSSDWVPDPGGKALQPSGAPRAVLIGGGPGSGKSTALKFLRARGEEPAQAVMIDTAAVARQLPEYDEGASKVSAEAVAVAGEALARAMEEGLSVVVEGTLGDGPSKVLDRVAALRLKGYGVRVMYVDAPVTDAATRLPGAVETGEVGEAHRKAAATFLGLLSRVRDDAVDAQLELWDNSQPKDDAPTLVFAFTPGVGEQVMDQGLWRRFQGKAYEPGAEAE